MSKVKKNIGIKSVFYYVTYNNEKMYLGEIYDI